MNQVKPVVLTLLSTILFSSVVQAEEIQTTKPVIAAYYPDWKVYNPRKSYSAGSIPTDKLTHVIYAFLGVCGPHSASPTNIQKIMAQQCRGKPTGTAVIVDNFAALQKQLPGKTDYKVRYKGNFGQLSALVKANPELVVLPSFGGWTLSEPFHTVVINPTYRKNFVVSAIDLLERYPFFGGIQLDWEYPGGNGLSGKGKDNLDQEKIGFTALLKELDHGLETLSLKHHRQYELSAAVSASNKNINNIDWPQVAQYLDHIFLMSYDFLGGWENIVGHHANLFATNKTPNQVSVDQQVNALLQRGVSHQQIIVGVPFYGRGWQQVEDFTPNTLEGLTSQSGLKKGSDLDDPGYFTYQDIATYLLNNPKLGYQYYYDEQAQAAVLYHPTKKEFITFDDQRSIKAKTDYVKQNQLGGIFTWEITADKDNQLIELISTELNR
ncbi:TPA: glycoside hydrolase family 18 protein [Photobacterium damselae]